MDLHPLLARQLRRSGIDDVAGPPPQSGWRELLARVSRAYRDHDEANHWLEHSQQLASDEMTLLHQDLQAQRDALERRVHERTEALRLSEARLSDLLAMSADWIWEQDADLRFTFVSTNLIGSVDVDPATFIGKTRDFGSGWEISDDERARYEQAIDARQPFRKLACAYRRDDGSVLQLHISGDPIFDGGGRFGGYRGVTTNVTAIELAEQRLIEMARQDSLTGLCNRQQFGIEVMRAIARCERHGGGFVVLCLDLNRFKVVNDTLGRGGGDALLKQVASRLDGAVRRNDIVARLGGDVFAILLDGMTDVASVTAVAAKLQAAVAAPLSEQDCVFELGASIGVAVYPQDGAVPEVLLKSADTAMYETKEAGQPGLRFYTEAMADGAMRAYQLETALRAGLARDELQLHYQPKVDPTTGAMVGMEALVRWERPGDGLVSPGEFIPLAEERGLIVALGKWVLNEACRQLAQWQAMGLPVVPVAVNLSAKQFSSGSFLDDVWCALKTHRIAPTLLELELTESTLMTDPQRAIETLKQLNAIGVALSIDDFGTGYSSLAYLKRFPARAVKIDRSFVRSLPSDPSDLAITATVITLAHGLGLTVVAEGVETQVQLDALRELGCDEVQGYLYARPAPPQTIEAVWFSGADALYPHSKRLAA